MSGSRILCYLFQRAGSSEAKVAIWWEYAVVRHCPCFLYRIYGLSVGGSIIDLFINVDLFCLALRTCSIGGKRWSFINMAVAICEPIHFITDTHVNPFFQYRPWSAYHSILMLGLSLLCNHHSIGWAFIIGMFPPYHFQTIRQFHTTLYRLFLSQSVNLRSSEDWQFTAFITVAGNSIEYHEVPDK